MTGNRSSPILGENVVGRVNDIGETLREVTIRYKVKFIDNSVSQRMDDQVNLCLQIRVAVVCLAFIAEPALIF